MLTHEVQLQAAQGDQHLIATILFAFVNRLEVASGCADSCGIGVISQQPVGFEIRVGIKSLFVVAVLFLGLFLQGLGYPGQRFELQPKLWW